MNEQQYVTQAIVNDFIVWIEPKLFADFNHSYTIRRGGARWECNSLFNAFENYSWDIIPDFQERFNLHDNSFTSNRTVLDGLSNQLRTSFTNEDIDGVFEASKEILRWGGRPVLGTETRGNLRYLIENRQNLIRDFAIAKTQMVTNGNLANNFENIKMNAGYTKIYSLLFDDFIIYDGRVGAALGLLVRKFLEDNNIINIPEELNFYWGAAYKGNHIRNPSNGRYIFQPLTNNSDDHIKCNMKANWLIKKIIEQHGFGENDAPMRALESALFMIGYELSPNNINREVHNNNLQDKHESNKSIAKTSNKKEILAMNNNVELLTLSLNNPRRFEYSGSMKEGITIYVGKKNSQNTVSKDICEQLLKRYSKTERPVIVGTSITEPTPGSMGEWLQGVGNRTNTASYLAAILVHECYATLVEGSRPMEIKFTEKK